MLFPGNPLSDPEDHNCRKHKEEYKCPKSLKPDLHAGNSSKIKSSSQKYWHQDANCQRVKNNSRVGIVVGRELPGSAKPEKSCASAKTGNVWFQLRVRHCMHSYELCIRMSCVEECNSNQKAKYLKKSCRTAVQGAFGIYKP